MTESQFLLSGDVAGRPTILLAHGAGAGMDTPFMDAISKCLAARGMRVARFEFSYMAARRTGGAKRPPPKVSLLEEEYRAAIDALPCDGPLIIGGKSMGGRVASHIADDLHAKGRIAGLLCLGYPFHPVGKPEKLRVDHLESLQAPTLICQGSRDPFGTRAEVLDYRLSPQISLTWLEDGNHDLRPRIKVTGKSHDQQLEYSAENIANWLGD